MSFLCPSCASPLLQITAAVRLRPDSRYDEIRPQTLRCSACGFVGLAVYEESRRGSLDSESYDHNGYPYPAAAVSGVERLMKKWPRAAGVIMQLHRWAGLERLGRRKQFPIIDAAREAKEETLLTFARSGATVGLESLLQAGCDLNYVNPENGLTALRVACLFNQVDVVRLLLARGADPNKWGKYPPLSAARSLEAMSALLEAGADPNARGEDGRTPLMMAALLAPADAINLLLRAGADPTLHSDAGLTAADVIRDDLRHTVPRMEKHYASETKRRLESILTLIEADEARRSVPV